MQRAIMLIVIILSVIMINVVMLSVFFEFILLLFQSNISRQNEVECCQAPQVIPIMKFYIK
jgi:hypothetical protein